MSHNALKRLWREENKERNGERPPNYAEPPTSTDRSATDVSNANMINKEGLDIRSTMTSIVSVARVRHG